MRYTLLLVAFVFVGFVVQLVSPDLAALITTYGFSTNGFLERPYVLVTSIFLHGGLDHLLGNIFVLLFFGLAVESELGKGRMLLIFFLGAFAGDLLSVFAFAPTEISIGASAGIFALIGVGMLVRPIDLSLVMPIPIAFIGMLYALYNVYGFISGTPSNVSYVGHFGGLFTGLAFGIQHTGWKRSLLIVGITLFIMVLIPVVWLLLVA